MKTYLYATLFLMIAVSFYAVFDMSSTIGLKRIVKLGQAYVDADSILVIEPIASTQGHATNLHQFMVYMKGGGLIGSASLDMDEVTRDRAVLVKLWDQLKANPDKEREPSIVRIFEHDIDLSNITYVADVQIENNAPTRYVFLIGFKRSPNPEYLMVSDGNEHNVRLIHDHLIERWKDFYD